MKNKLLLSLSLTIMSLTTLTGCGSDESKEYNDEGKMVLNLRNLYFNDWTGGDTYTSYIENKFNVAITPSSYSWADWDQQVYGPVNANNLTDVFHFDLDNYNFSNSYQMWANGGVTKPLPDNMDKWPNLKRLIDSASNVDKLYINGKLYCIPVVKNIKEAATVYSPFTYVYRRDWAKELGVYQQDDVYTWEQFTALISAFYKNKCQSGDIAAIADVEWGYPSLINFYKTAPHCFAIVDNKVVCNFTSELFLEGLDLARAWTKGTNKYYGYDQYAANAGDVAKQFYAGRVGVFYENLSLANYTQIRKSVGERSEIVTKEQLDDATAIMKVMGPDGKYALEGTENWFSATFFNADISDEKQAKILDILEWLLTDEGTMMALYGIEGYDYTKDASGNVTLLEDGWEKDLDGKYIDKLNGAKFLRYMSTLGYDTSKDDPLVDKEALNILNNWYQFMDVQLANNNLKIVEEDGKVKWLTTATKSGTTPGGLLDGGNTAVVQYAYEKIDKDTYLSKFDNNTWKSILSEINSALGK